MKTSKISILIIVFSILSLINSKLMSATSDVDSVYNALKGTWYMVGSVNGFTGKYSPIYDSDSTVITRIGVTDSIKWIDYHYGRYTNSFRYLITYAITMNYREFFWMLKGDMKGLILFFHPDRFGYSADGADGESASYSRTKLSSDIIETNSPNEKLLVILDQMNNSFSICGILNVQSAAIYDFNGRCKQRISNVMPGQSIDTRGLIPGVYIISVDTGHGIYKARLIKN